MAELTLLSYVDHHGVRTKAGATHSELAVVVARHFQAMNVDEEECVGGFLERLEKGPGNAVSTEYSRSTSNFTGQAPSVQARQRKRAKWAAYAGEQVAAKVTRGNENGSWILASVLKFYPETETYDVQDEDDTSRVIRLPWHHVMRLSKGTEGCFAKKGTACMAVFPETTSFYRAQVSKSPIWKLDRIGVPMVEEVIVKFEDDEDMNGLTPHRRIPSRYVIPVPAVYFYESSDDIDLVPPKDDILQPAAAEVTTTATEAVEEAPPAVTTTSVTANGITTTT